MNDVIELIKENEGFSGTVYRDSRGFDTIGFGTLLPITEAEATLLLEHRLDKIITELEHYIKLDTLPRAIQVVLINMAYNLGVPKLLKFKKMFKAIEEQDYQKMIVEMKDSKWYNQVKNRADELINIVEDYIRIV